MADNVVGGVVGGVVGIVIGAVAVGEVVGAGSRDPVCFRCRFSISWVSTGSGTAVADGAGAACVVRPGGAVGGVLAGDEDAGSRVGSATGVAGERSDAREATGAAARVALGVDVAATGGQSSAVGVPVESPPGSPTRGPEAVV